MIRNYRDHIMGDEVEAVQLTSENVKEVAAWCNGQDVEELDPFDPYTKRFAGINVPTPRGILRASEGDYIIRGPSGQFTRYKPGIFHDTFQIT